MERDIASETHVWSGERVGVHPWAFVCVDGPQTLTPQALRAAHNSRPIVSRPRHVRGLRLRIGALGTTLEEALNAACARLGGALLAPCESTASVAFLFAGQGEQVAGMGAQLYKELPIFARALEHFSDALTPPGAEPLLQVMHASDPDADIRLTRTWHAQRALVALECALVELWRGAGVKAAAVLGHSIGEIVAAYAARVFDGDTLARLVRMRAELMDALPAGGTMLAVRADEARVRGLLGDFPQVSVAAVNSRRNVVVAGPVAAMDALKSSLRSAEIVCQPLRVANGFHSECVMPAANMLRERLVLEHVGEPAVPLVSNLLGDFCPPGTKLDAQYWAEHARGTVRFSSGLDALRRKGHSHFLEIGPGATLSALARSHLKDASLTWLTSMDGSGSETRAIVQTALSLFELGVDIDWSAFFPN